MEHRLNTALGRRFFSMDPAKTERERERERERAQNSELYYSRIEILSNSLFLQSVHANLHTQHT